MLVSSCSNQKNTKTTRWYHATNTRYNIHFNAEEAYKEALKAKNTGYKDNLSEMIKMYPYPEEDEQKKETGGPFDVTIDKSTKAIKLHSIQVKPERNPGKRGDAKYQEWLKQREFNPFLKNSWLLMAKAEYQNNDYLKAISTFSYTSRLYRTDIDVVTECQLWMALAYTQMGWFYEADNIFHQIELAGGVPAKHKELFSEVYANYLIRNKEYEKAVPYMELAVKSAKGIQKTRIRYLMAQIYGQEGDALKAYKAFGKVPGMSTPYEYTFNAKIQQVKYAPEKDKQKMISMLKGMAKSSKNAEYLDQVYSTLGDIYLQDQDTAKAIENYKLAVKKSTRNGYDKALCQVTLGDIYFIQRDYVNAYPCYSEAVGVLSKKHDDYPRVSLRADVLGELVVHVEAIHLQDSLQHLARLPEPERLEAINKIITDLKKKEEAEKKLAEREGNMEQQDSDDPFFTNRGGNTRPGMPVMPGMQSSEFYYYNPQSVSQGKIAFQQRWGNRKLEDNWRRRDKRVTTFDDTPHYAENDENGTTQEGDSIQKSGAEQMAVVTDVYTPEFYLQQLPLSEEAITASNEIIEDAYFQMGGIYTNKLNDFNLAVDAYLTDIKRFPQTPNLEEIYYQLFLIYSRMGNKSLADLYKDKLIAEFSKGNYAKTLSDPNYEWNLRNLGTLQESIYDKTYEAYLAGNTSKVRSSVHEVKEKFPVSPLMPKFMFLNALTYAQTNDAGKMGEELKGLVEKYPDSDVTPLASEILKNLLAGRPLAMGGGPMRGMVWDLRFGDPMAEVDSLMRFSKEQDVDYELMLLFPAKSINKNQLIYDVADYNFSNFVLKTFDLDFSVVATYEMLEVKGLDSFSEMKEYVQKAFRDSSLISKLDPQILFIPISVENYNVLMRGKSLNEYMAFFVENYGREFPRLINLWNRQVSSKEGDEPKVEEQPVVEPEIEEENKEGEKPKEPETVDKEPQVDQTINGVNPVDVVKPKVEDGNKSKNVEIKASDILSDDKIETIEKVGNAAKKIIDNPVEGVKSVLQKRKEQSGMTKEEREALKEQEDERKRLEQEEKDRIKVQQDSIRNEQKEKERLIKEAEAEQKAAERAKIEEEKRKEQEKIDEVKAAQKAKEDARKQRQQELKDKEKAQKEKLKQREQERKDRQKQREQERREKERAAREKQKNRQR